MEEEITYIKAIEGEDFNYYRKFGMDISLGGVLMKYNGTASEVEIPFGVTEIADEAFKNCRALKSVLIPDSVERIGAWAFYHCVNLWELRIGSGVKRISHFAFSECTALTTLVYHGSKGAWNAINKSRVWEDGTGEYKTTFLGSTTGIFTGRVNRDSEQEQAFMDEESLDEVSQDQVSGFRRYLHVVLFILAGISAAAFVAISVLYSGNHAGLDYVMHAPLLLLIPTGLSVLFMVLGMVAYRLRDKHWKKSGSGITAILFTALFAAPVVYSLVVTFVGIADAHYRGAGKGYTYLLRNNGTVALERRALRLTPHDVTLPSEIDGYTVSEVSQYGVFGYNDSTVRSLTIPDSVTRIDDYSIEYCRSLTSLTLPDELTDIGSRSFYECKALQSIKGSAYAVGAIAKECGSSSLHVEITSGTEITNYTFDQCGNIKSITLSDTVSSISSNAFQGCSRLEYNEYDNGLYLGTASNPYYALIKMKNDSLQTLSLQEDVKIIASSAIAESMLFNEYGNAKYLGTESNPYFALIAANDDASRLTIHENTKIIRNNAFQYQNGLTSVTIPNGVRSIGDSAFYNSSLTSVTIPGSVTSIGSHAFSDCGSLTSVSIGSGVTNIGSQAFSDCDSLTSVRIPDSVKHLGTNVFSQCNSLRSVTIGNGVTSIGDYAFYTCSNLTSVTIPDSVKTIGYNAFSYCTKLTSVVIPDGVTSIGYGAFAQCFLLDVTIPSSVTVVDRSAFYGCKNVSYQGTKAEWEAIVQKKEDDDYYYSGDSYAPYTVHCTDGYVEVD